MATNSQIAFNPQGNTVVVAADPTSPLGVQVPGSARVSNSAGQFRIVNAGNVTVHLGVGATDAVAQANAVAATAGNPAAGIPLVPGAVEVMRFAPEVYFSAVAASATTIYITPGAGM